MSFFDNLINLISKNDNYMNEKEIKEILKKYDKKYKNKKKVLVVCHGTTHTAKFRNALLLNAFEEVKPNLILDLWSKKYMSYLPENYFDKIIMQYCPLGNPIKKANEIMWKNLYRILKKDGFIENSSILGLYGINIKGKWYKDLSLKQKKITIDTIDEYFTKKLKFSKIKHKDDKKEKDNKITILIK